jgi:Tol biopolymer transport system component
MLSHVQHPSAARRGLGILLMAWMLVVIGTACGTLASTSVSATPSVVAPASATPIGAQLTEAPGSASAAPTEMPTKVGFAVTLTPEPAQATTAPKPSAPTGRIAYTIVTGREPRFFAIWVANANGSNQHQILTHGQWPTFSPDGKQIAYFGRPEGKSEGLYIANSDGGNAMGPLAISPGVCCLDWSRDGNWIVYVMSGKPSDPGGPIWKLKVDGMFQTRVDLKLQGNGPAFSPDNKQIVYSGGLPNTTVLGLMLVSADGGVPRQITTDNGGNAQWSPRGDRIVYQARDSVGMQVFTINPDGSGKRQLTHGKSNDGQPVWSRDGGSIFWRSDQNGTAWAIYVMNADGSSPHKLIDNTPPDPDLWGWESLSAGP